MSWSTSDSTLASDTQVKMIFVSPSSSLPEHIDIAYLLQHVLDMIEAYSESLGLVPRLLGPPPNSNSLTGACVATTTPLLQQRTDIEDSNSSWTSDHTFQDFEDVSLSRANSTPFRNKRPASLEMARWSYISPSLVDLY